MNKSRIASSRITTFQPFIIIVLFICTVFLTACGGGVTGDASSPSVSDGDAPAGGSTPAGDGSSGGDAVDTTPPNITITSPTSVSSYTASSNTISLGGTASDNVGVTQVTWVNSRGGSGTASGTTSWSVSKITLQSGTNTLTVTARDATGNNKAGALVITYSTGAPADTTAPTVTIAAPTSAPTYLATSSTLNLAGSASDNVGVTRVTWTNNRGGSGTASGSTSWSIGNISLQSGGNVISVTALDAGGNIATDTLSVTYNAGDTTAPTVAIVSPTSASPYTAPSNTISLGGTASDNIGVTQVTWLNNRGGSGTASGTTSWAITGAALQQGQNIITVTARDAANNTNAVSFIAYYNSTAANVYYVATTGGDVLGDGSAARPWKTIGYGISQMASGDTLIVKKGLYTGLANFITGIPSGAPGKYTVVTAETPMEVRIQSTGTLNYGDSDLLGISGSYINVDGFIFDLSGPGSLTHPFVGTIGAGEGGGSANFNKITRCIFKRSDLIYNWGALLNIDGSNNLVEDVAGVGACRYCFEQGGPGSSIKNNIYRRVVVRFDYSNSNQPKAAFASYGNNATNDMRDHLYQNIIAIDGQRPTTVNSNDTKYGAIYNPKRSTNIRYFGSIVLNEAVGYAGMFLTDWGTGHEVRHSVVWDLPGSGNGSPAIRPNNASAPITIIDQVTLGGNIPGTSPDNLVSNGITATNSLLGATPPSGNLLNNTPAGAVIMKRYGVSGTLWGEPGYDQLTTEDLWPWPYEDKIKAVFAEPNNPPSGSTPTTNNTTRGFAASGNGLYGGPITLTSYIWEYLGTPCPVSVCTAP